LIRVDFAGKKIEKLYQNSDEVVQNSAAHSKIKVKRSFPHIASLKTSSSVGSQAPVISRADFTNKKTISS
jgi:hypothetical protein